MSEAIPITPDFSPAADLEAGYRAYMVSLIEPNGPAANTRASGIGNECERAITYDRVAPADQRSKHTPELQAIFELGKDFEKIAIHRLENMGADIVQKGRDYNWREYQLSGHVDAKIRMPRWPRAYQCEIKGLNPYTGESIHGLEDIKDSRQPWVRKYYAQLQSYLLLAGEEMGVYVLFNKSTGWPTFIDCPLDYEYAERLLKRAERVKLHVAQGTLPDRHISNDCRRCQFLALCNPNIDFGPGVLVLDDPELHALVKRREELYDAAAEYRAVDKALKNSLPAREGEILVGDFVLTRELTHRKGFPMPPTSFYRTDIRKIGDK
jgi:CRISPR/Cas system-associated exonuclease Cas4 (RecB family)